MLSMTRVQEAGEALGGRRGERPRSWPLVTTCPRGRAACVVLRGGLRRGGLVDQRDPAAEHSAPVEQRRLVLERTARACTTTRDRAPRAIARAARPLPRAHSSRLTYSGRGPEARGPCAVTRHAPALTRPGRRGCRASTRGAARRRRRRRARPGRRRTRRRRAASGSSGSAPSRSTRATERARAWRGARADCRGSGDIAALPSRRGLLDARAGSRSRRRRSPSTAGWNRPRARRSGTGSSRSRQAGHARGDRDPRRPHGVSRAGPAIVGGPHAAGSHIVARTRPLPRTQARA